MKWNLRKNLNCINGLGFHIVRREVVLFTTLISVTMYVEENKSNGNSSSM